MPSLSDNQNQPKRKLNALRSVSSQSMGVFREQLYSFTMEIFKTCDWLTLSQGFFLILSCYECQIKYNYIDLEICLSKDSVKNQIQNSCLSQLMHRKEVLIFYNDKLEALSLNFNPNLISISKKKERERKRDTLEDVHSFAELNKQLKSSFGQRWEPWQP